MEGPLSGIRVRELGTLIAAPLEHGCSPNWALQT